MPDQSCVSYGCGFFDLILSLPRSDLEIDSFRSRVAAKYPCNITVYIFWLLQQIRAKKIFCPENQAPNIGTFWPKFLIPPGRGEMGGEECSPPISSITTASGISKLNTFAEQAQSIIKDCQATLLDCKSVCGDYLLQYIKVRAKQSPSCPDNTPDCLLVLTAHWVGK